MSKHPERGYIPELPLDYTGPVTADDRPAFETFGLEWPEECDEAVWIEKFQQQS